MAFDQAWMSCRPTTAAKMRDGGSFLPQFTVPPSANPGFTLEARPPALPARSSALQTIGLCVTVIVCVVGAVEILQTAAEPTVRHGQRLWGGMATAVSSALAHANDAADRRQLEHVEATQRYLELVDKQREPRRPRELQQQELQELDRAPVADRAPAERRVRHSLLLRIAALARSAEPGSMDVERVSQLFPQWVTSETDVELKTDKIVLDLVQAVGLLSQERADQNRKC